MELKEYIQNLFHLSEDERKPLIKWFDAFEKALKKLKGSYSKVKPTDMLALYYDGVDPAKAAAQLKESVLDEGKMKEFFMDIHDELEKAMDKKWYREMQSSNGAQGLDNIISNTHKQLYGKGDPDPKDIADAIIAKYGRNHKEYMKLSMEMMRRNESVELSEDSHWVLSFEFNMPEYTSTLGRQIQNELRRKFKKTYSGSGSGGAGWDISFNGSKKELEKAKKYVEKEYKKFIDSTQTQFVMDESVELDEKRNKTDIPASPEIKKWIESGRAKILMSTDSTLGGNSQFVIIENPEYRNSRVSGEDKVLMFTISDPKRGRIKMFSFHGSHVNVKGAMKFAKNNKLVTGWIHNVESLTDDEMCTNHKRCGQKNNKHLLLNPLRDYEKDELEGSAEYTKGKDNKVEKKAQKVREDAAVNNVGGGEIAGIAPGEDPPVKKRKKFAGCDVFEVDTDTYYKCVQGKKKFEHWKRYFDRETGGGAEIYEFAYKYPRKAIIVQNKITQEMVYLRHSRK